MAKKKKALVQDPHAKCDHTPEAHAAMARIQTVAGDLLNNGVNENAHPVGMMIGCMLLGMKAGIMFPKEAQRLIDNMGFDANALVELNEGATDLLGIALPHSTQQH